MKKMMMLLFVLILRVSIYPQAEMLEIEATFTDSTQVEKVNTEIIHFSDAQIAKIINQSIELNPRTNGLNTIQSNTIVTLKINDSTLYYFIPSEGTSCWKTLKKGIKKNELEKIQTFQLSSPHVADSVFQSDFLKKTEFFLENRNYSLRSYLEIKDSILVNNESTSGLDFDSSEKEPSFVANYNLAKKDSNEVMDSNLIRNESKFQPNSSDKIMPQIEKRVEVKSDNKDSVNEGIISDTFPAMKSNHIGGEDYSENGERKENLSFPLTALSIMGIIIFMVNYYSGKEHRRIKKETRKFSKDYHSHMNGETDKKKGAP